ncbi:MAG: hypothetical protein BJ554DRAFT_1263 [Olpidium bornovanus]|uniref:Uncharacterized protein n=1 Tax=Olpidium bornovanus TaxID=278681 RepID=A0A8H8DHW7_9FUNG|nr:MAG: hypothetical protein BJ554DRAFT_1263 [Olpidium bornovanus]
MKRFSYLAPKRRWSADEVSAVVEFAKSDDGSRKSLDVLISGRSYRACAQLVSLQALWHFSEDRWGKLKWRGVAQD